MIPQAKWQWFGSPGHFIGAWNCHYHLCTLVGKWLISTVGEYYPLKSKQPGTLGCDKRLYETMVFRAGRRCQNMGCNCAMPFIGPKVLDMMAATVRGNTAKNHMAMCMKWAKKEKANAR